MPHLGKIVQSGKEAVRGIIGKVGRVAGWSAHSVGSHPGRLAGAFSPAQDAPGGWCRHTATCGRWEPDRAANRWGAPLALACLAAAHFAKHLF